MTPPLLEVSLGKAKWTAGGEALADHAVGAVDDRSLLFPARSLNSAVFGRCDAHPNEACDCGVDRPSVCYCGKSISETGCVLVEESESGVWSSAQLATCKSAWVCDFCSRRHEAEARERAEWLISRHLDAGGSIVHATFTLRHRRGVDLGTELVQLRDAFGELRTLAAWDRLDVEEWVRVLQVTYSIEHEWHAHFHVLLFVADDSIPEGELKGRLRPAWNARLERQGASGGNASVESRYVQSVEEALYPWRYAPDEPDDFYHPNAWTDFDWHDPDPDRYHPQGGDGGLSPWSIAALAGAGDARALSLWFEFFEATKGVPVSSYSKGLREVWKAHVEEGDQGSPVVERLPVALVASDLWNTAWSARGYSLADVGLRVGRWHGVDAMAAFWSARLSRPVEVGAVDGLPFVYFPSTEGVFR